MNFKAMQNAVTSKVARQILIGQKHSPEVLFVGGVIGVAGTVVLACRATLKVEEVLDHAERKRGRIDQALKISDPKRYSERDAKRDRVFVKVQLAKDLTKLYAPAVGLGVVSVGALTGSHVILTRRNVAITAAYKALDEGFNEYRKRVRDEFGEEKELELRHDIREREVRIEDSEDGERQYKKTRMPAKASIYARFFDELNPNWKNNYELNIMFLTMVQNYCSDRLHAKGHLFLNEVYDELGIDRTKAGQVVGWIVGKDGEGDPYVDFGLHDASNAKKRDFINGREPAVLLDFNVAGPIYDMIEKKR